MTLTTHLIQKLILAMDSEIPDLSNYINRVQSVEITMSEQAIIVEGLVTTVYDAPKSGIFHVAFSRFLAYIVPTEPIDCFNMDARYSANTTSFFQADFTHELRPGFDLAPVLEQIDRWGIASQSESDSTAADQFKFNFDIEIVPN